MEAFKQEDMAELGHFFNFDQAANSNAQQAQRGKTIVSSRFAAPIQEGQFIPTHQQTFQAPSHQYDLFKQQAGLAPGAFQHAIPQARSLSQQQHSFAMNSNTVPLFDMSEADGFSNMEMDGFLESNTLSFMDPMNMSSSSDAGDLSPVTQSHQRLWPGMHQQQAAKAQQEQAKKIEQQKLQHEQMQQRMMQQQLATQQASEGHQRRPSQGRNKPTDPAVEERITQILRQMRASTSSTNSGSSSTPQTSGAHAARSRKDEEDMDEDERLLASEEGKKLSSKERRQLRNKVSARAFRSRRKEYISQLEGELSAKAQEADELRSDNEALRSENTQLSDLVRMLLREPAFNNVVEDLSQRVGQPPVLPSQNSQHRRSIPHAQTPQTLAPQPASSSAAMDFASTPMDGWNSGISPPQFDFNPNVFAVFELPEPIIDTNVLSGKGSEFPVPTPVAAAKSDMPIIERRERPAPLEAVLSVHEEASADDTDDCPALFASEPALAPPVSSERTEENGYRLFGDIPLEKAFARIELVSEDGAEDTDVAREARFIAACESLDRATERVAMVLGEL